jgi:hypothetical protein
MEQIRREKTGAKWKERGKRNGIGGKGMGEVKGARGRRSEQRIYNQTSEGRMRSMKGKKGHENVP